MRKRKQKIEIATSEDVKRYGGGDGGETAEAPAKATEAELEPSAKEPEPQTQADESPEQQIATLSKQVQELTDKHLRAVAEHQNYVRRAAAERAEAVRYAPADLVKDLLTVVDDIERTLAAIPEDEAPSVVEGVRLIYDNLIKTLEAHHVERITAVGQPFDPACHQAMMQQPSADQPPNTVIEEYQAGYKLCDRVIRPAKVVVSTAPAQDGKQAPAEGEEQREDQESD